MIVPFVPVVVSRNKNLPDWMDLHEYSSAMRLPAMTYSLSRACSRQPSSLSPCGSAGGAAALPLTLVGVEEGRGWEVEERLGCRWVVVCVFLWPSLQLLNEAKTTWSVTESGLSTTTRMENTILLSKEQSTWHFLTYRACFVAWLTCQPLRGKWLDKRLQYAQLMANKMSVYLLLTQSLAD